MSFNALELLSTIALSSEYSNFSSNNVSGFCTPREYEDHENNVPRQFRSPSMHAKELHEHDFYRALNHPSSPLHRIKRDHDGNHVSVATGQLLVPSESSMETTEHVTMKAYIPSPPPNSTVTTPLRPTFHKGINILGNSNNVPMTMHGTGVGIVSESDTHVPPPPPPSSSSLPFHPSQYPPVSVPGSLRISNTNGIIHRESPFTHRPPLQQPSSLMSSTNGTTNGIGIITPREPSKLMTYLERTRRSVPTAGPFMGFHTINPHTPAVVPGSPILGERRSLTLPITSASTSCYRDGNNNNNGGSIQSGATSPMSCMSVESHDTFQSVVGRDRTLSVESIGSIDNRSTDGQGQVPNNGQNPDLLNSIQQLRIRRLKMTATPGVTGPTTVSSSQGGRNRGVSL